MKDKVIQIRRSLRKMTSTEVTDRWNYEEGVSLICMVIDFMCLLIRVADN